MLFDLEYYNQSLCGNLIHQYCEHIARTSPDLVAPGPGNTDGAY